MFRQLPDEVEGRMIGDFKGPRIIQLFLSTFVSVSDGFDLNDHLSSWGNHTSTGWASSIVANVELWPPLFQTFTAKFMTTWKLNGILGYFEADSALFVISGGGTHYRCVVLMIAQNNDRFANFVIEKKKNGSFE